jgi:uncharacterized protein (TIGR02284 family)
MSDQNSNVKTVVEILHDGHKGFADIGEHLKDANLKAYFLKESKTRESFARELELAAGFDSNVGGTASGAIHRTWGDLKAHLGGGDHTLLETAEQGEDAAKKAYREALEDTTVPATVREVLQKQEGHIRSSHDQVKAFRDSTK